MTINAATPRHVGSLLINAYGERRNVSLIMGRLSWLTANSGRYRRSDGSLTSSAWATPRLLLETVHSDLNSEYLYRPITHVCRLRAFGDRAGHSSIGYLYENKGFFLLDQGIKIDKNTLWSVTNYPRDRFIQIIPGTIKIFTPEWKYKR